MNKKQKEAKRKNAQAHQKKSKELSVQRENALTIRREVLPERRLFKADRVITEAPESPLDPLVVDDVFGKFFAEKLKEDGLAISPSNAKDFLTIASSYPIIGRKCK